MISEDLEFQISQYVDGTLSPAQMKCVDELMAADPRAKKVLADYRRLNSELAGAFAGAPINWDRLSTRISSHIDQEQLAGNDRPTVAGRIGFTPMRLRLAAAVMLAGTAFIAARLSIRHSHPAAAPAITPPSVSIVTGPEAEVATGTPTTDVSIGPSPALTARDSRYGEGVISRGPSRVVIVGMATKKTADPHLH